MPATLARRRITPITARIALGVQTARPAGMRPRRAMPSIVE